MTANACDREATSGWVDPPAGGEVVEVTFLVLRDHLRALEHLADAEGITVGRLLRRTIRDHFAHEHRPDSDAEIRPGIGPPGRADAGRNHRGTRGAMTRPNEEDGR
jgi:hypothetical protein